MKRLIKSSVSESELSKVSRLAADCKDQDDLDALMDYLKQYIPELYTKFYGLRRNSAMSVSFIAKQISDELYYMNEDASDSVNSAEGVDTVKRNVETKISWINVILENYLRKYDELPEELQMDFNRKINRIHTTIDNMSSVLSR